MTVLKVFKNGIERTLGPSEKLFWVLSHECSFNFVMHAQVEGHLSVDLFRPALNAIQARHPLLNVCIVRAGWNTLKFKASGVPEIPLRLSQCPSAEWTVEAEKELHGAFPVDQGPLVRCAWLQHGPGESTVLLAFHHAIGDAISGTFLLRDLIEALAMVEKGRKPFLEPLEPKQAMNAYFPAWAKKFSARWRYYKFVGRLLGATIRWGQPTLPEFDRKVPACERRARIVAHQIAPSVVERLHEKAHREKTTLHGAFLAAQVLAIANDLQKPEKLLYLIGSPVNLRKKLIPPIGQDIGHFVTIGGSLNRADPSTEFWPLAREIRASLWNCVERGEPFVYPLQHKDLSAITALMGLTSWGIRAYSRIAGMLNMGGLALSNIGKVEIETIQEPFKIESLGFAASGSGLSPLISFAATIERQSTWNFVGMEPLLSKSHTERIADSAMEILHDAIASP